MRVLTHPGRQRGRQLDREHHVRLGHLHRPRLGRLDVPAPLPHRHREPLRHNTGNLATGAIPAASNPAAALIRSARPTSSNTTTSHDTIILPIMSPLPFAAPGQFQTPITQRHLETEVPHCVGGVISPLLMNVALHGMEAAAGVRYSHDRHPCR